MTPGCFNWRLGDFCINKNSKITSPGSCIAEVSRGNSRRHFWKTSHLSYFQLNTVLQDQSVSFQRGLCLQSGFSFDTNRKVLQPFKQRRSQCGSFSISTIIRAGQPFLIKRGILLLDGLWQRIVAPHKLVWRIRWYHSHQLEALNLSVTGSGGREEIWLAGFECSRPKICPVAL